MNPEPLKAQTLPMVDTAHGMNLGQMIDQCTNDSNRWFPEAQDLPTMTLAMCGEAGEVANLVKKIVRGSLTIEDALDYEYMNELEKDTLQEEVVDVLIYLCNLMGLTEFKDVNWKEIWNDKRNFNEERFGYQQPPTVTKGSGITLSAQDQWGR